jgi:hypothetical protein
MSRRAPAVQYRARPFIEAFLAQTRLGPPNQDRYKARP